MDGFVNTEIINKIGIITFHHPKSNSLPSNILKKMAEEVKNLSDNENVNVIVLKSTGGKAFCAGASFDELISIEEFDDGLKFFSGFANVINNIRKSKKFVIVSVNGKAIGGGVGLAAAGDYTFAVKNADIKLSEFALGIGPFVVGPAVERKIGKSAFAQISTDFEFYSAEWAFNKGLYAVLCENEEELNSNVMEFAEKMAGMSLEATAELKKIFWEGTENWDELLIDRAKISGKLVLSDFTKDYIKKFKEKNK